MRSRNATMGSRIEGAACAKVARRQPSSRHHQLVNHFYTIQQKHAEQNPICIIYFINNGLARGNVESVTPSLSECFV